MSRFIGDYRSMELYKKNIAFNISFWVLYFLYEWLSQAVFNCEWMRYFINASVSAGNQLADEVLNVMSVEVEPGRFYPSGKLPQANKGFLVDYEWKM